MKTYIKLHVRNRNELFRRFVFFQRNLTISQEEKQKPKISISGKEIVKYFSEDALRCR